MSRRPVVDDETKVRALQRSEEVGSAQAARELGISAATIRGWRHRSGQVRPPAGVDPVDWGQRKAAGAEEAWTTAQQALAQVRALLAAGKAGEAQRASLSFAILVDKSGMLEAAAQRARALTTEQRALHAVEALLGALGLEVTDPIRGAVSFYAADGDGLAPDLAAAAAEVREQVAASEARGLPGADGGGGFDGVAEVLFEAGVLVCPRCAGRDERDDRRGGGPPPLPQLPAPVVHPDGGGHDENEEAEPMIGARRVVQVLRERAHGAFARAPEPQPGEERGEVVRGEVVGPDEPPDPEAALHWDEAVWERRS